MCPFAKQQTKTSGILDSNLFYGVSDIQNGEPRPISAHSLMGPLIKQVVFQSPRAHKDNNLHFKISSQQKKKSTKTGTFTPVDFQSVI